MAISVERILGNIFNDIGEGAGNILSQVRTKIQGIIGGAVTGISNLWDGGFAGIDEKNIDSLKTAIENYCIGVDDIINRFDENGNLEVAYKGKVQEASQDFVRAVKMLLVAYVSLMRQSLADLDEAVRNYQSSTTELASQIASNAQDIRSNADAIRLD